MDSKRILAGASVSATGMAVFLIALTAATAGLPSIYDFGLAGLGIVVGLLLVATGAGLFAFEELQTAHVIRVAGWNALGVVVLALVLGLVVASPSISLPAAVIADVLGVSAIAHVLIGVNDVRRIRVGELARERQKLAVLNRIVRHNLRNDAQILLGNAETLATSLEDERLANMATTVAETADGLATMNDKLGQFQAAIDHDPTEERTVDLTEPVGAVVEEIQNAYPDATVDTDLSEDCLVRADDKLAVAIHEAIENAVVHGGENVRVTSSREDGRVEVTITDDGPGIPDHELTPLEDDTEITQLEHGTGVGLWVLDTIVDAYGGTLTFDTDDGASVTISLPAA
ncbi:sensor histidine kinase KdpD [Halorhabdus sp. CUG00001]|uniref:sensor histidine kinase n=1 Tax=Halorhabdus sp. CUG00001 TaxID=2600297 RepID=UPI00131ACB80|nr:HAMP domain-containing sensor histidine kinase [Halorhabdus sp. CUG00001]